MAEILSLRDDIAVALISEVLGIPATEAERFRDSKGLLWKSYSRYAQRVMDTIEWREAQSC